MVEQVKDTKWNRIRQMMEDTFNSNWYLAVELLIAVLGFYLKAELIAITSLVLLLGVNFIFCKDCTSSIFTFCLISMVPLGFYGASIKDFADLFILLIFIPPCFIAHLFLYPAKNLLRGEMMLSLGLYSIALIIGGIGSISFSEYFQLAPLYYILILGPGMICFYIYFTAYIPDNTEKVIDYVTRGMITLGIMICGMWITAVIQNVMEGNELTLFFPFRQWKNNIGNFSLLCFPFAFYASTYKKHGWAYFLFGFVLVGCIILSMCRGAIVASIVLFPVTLIITFLFTKKKSTKVTHGIVLGVLALLGIIILIIFREEFLHKLQAAISYGTTGRNRLYDEAWQNFLSNPIFGVGIGYRNDAVYDLKSMSMFWYHSTFMQVIGSMGLIGLGAWGYLTYVRCRILLKKNAFNVFMLISFLGFEAYSMINTGDFSPFPFVTFLTFLLTVTSKNNAYIKSKQKLEQEEVNNNKEILPQEMESVNA